MLKFKNLRTKKPDEKNNFPQTNATKIRRALVKAGRTPDELP